MNILVNGTPILAPMTGIGQYIRHLFTAMDTLPEAEISLFLGLRCRPGFDLPSPEAARATQLAYGLMRRLLPKPRALKRLMEAASFSYHSRRSSADSLYHEPNFLPHPFPGPTVVTVHDLSCFDHPETHPAERVRIVQSRLPAAIERADQIITISEATGREIRRRFGLAPDRLTVTPLAADARFHPRPAPAVATALSSLDLTPGAYILTVGTQEPRKNLPTLFAAYAGLPTDLRRRYPLVVAGMAGWHTESLLRSARQLIAQGELRLLGYIPDDVLPYLYAGAVAFAFPSRYEGFGLPPLEAMASGVPVIAANRTSLPEVVGSAGILLDPDDVDGFREALQHLLEDKSYATDLASRGIAHARGFTWERCAQQTLGAYRQALRRRGLTQS